jgi:hypothetical protein
VTTAHSAQRWRTHELSTHGASSARHGMRRLCFGDGIHTPAHHGRHFLSMGKTTVVIVLNHSLPSILAPYVPPGMYPNRNLPRTSIWNVAQKTVGMVFRSLFPWRRPATDRWQQTGVRRRCEGIEPWCDAWQDGAMRIKKNRYTWGNRPHGAVERENEREDVGRRQHRPLLREHVREERRRSSKHRDRHQRRD